LTARAEEQANSIDLEQVSSNNLEQASSNNLEMASSNDSKQANSSEIFNVLFLFLPHSIIYNMQDE